MFQLGAKCEVDDRSGIFAACHGDLEPDWICRVARQLLCSLIRYKCVGRERSRLVELRCRQSNFWIAVGYWASVMMEWWVGNWEG